MQQARIATAVDRWPRASLSQIGCQVHPDESVTHMDSDLVTWNVILDTCSSPLAAAPGSSASCWLSFWQRATVHFSCVGLWGLQGKLLSCAALGSKGLECLTPGLWFADGWRSDQKVSFEISKIRNIRFERVSWSLACMASSRELLPVSQSAPEESAWRCPRKMPALSRVVPPLALAATALSLLGLILAIVALAKPAPQTDPMASLPPLTGVNAGGWLNLEDWFFSGVTGRNVMSLVNRGQGACLPPAVLTMDDYWPSEGFLTMRLNQSRGPAFTAEAFEAHRRSFIGEEDFQGMASLKLQLLRLPLHWAAFADALAPIDHELYGKHNPDEDTAIVPDPYYNGLAAFATVPRKWLASQLRKAAQNNLRVVLDLHAFPGGAANGTYNGVWPSPPAFWKEKSNVGNRSVALKDAGLMVVKAMVQWVEGLDDTARGAVAGVTVMNEPAHMNQGSAFASEADILQWLSDASNMFRQSKLPGMGVKLYMQLIGTAFRDFDGTVVPWFHKTFSSQEQSKWAVADLHFYIAWGGCDGRVISGGGFACDDPLDEIRQKIDGCVKSFTQDFRKNFGGLRAVTEFSTGTFQDMGSFTQRPTAFAPLIRGKAKTGGFWRPSCRCKRTPTRPQISSPSSGPGACPTAPSLSVAGAFDGSQAWSSRRRSLARHLGTRFS
ncbi:unnamed protein product [Effrenium voratum]|nr:unnamed protein product [Effrenium voratum]